MAIADVNQFGSGLIRDLVGDSRTQELPHAAGAGKEGTDLSRETALTLSRHCHMV